MGFKPSILICQASPQCKLQLSIQVAWSECIILRGFTSGPFPPAPSSVLMVYIPRASPWASHSNTLRTLGTPSLKCLHICWVSSWLPCKHLAAIPGDIFFRLHRSHLHTAFCYTPDYRKKNPHWIPLQRFPALIILGYSEVGKQVSKSAAKTQMVWDFFKNWICSSP